jgi:hypothetical protein
VPGVEGMEIDSAKKVTRIYLTNTTIINLYKYAYPDLANKPEQRIILDVTNPSKYTIDDFDSFLIWKNTNTYSYELIIPPTPKEKALEYMREDLKRYFGLGIRTEKHLVKALVLTFSGSLQKIASKGGALETNIYSGGTPIIMRNCPIDMLVCYLNQNKIFKFPVINETNISSTVDLMFPESLTKADYFISTLKKYGFEFKEVETNLDVGIITDK